MGTDLETPILYLIFNRYEETYKSFSILKKIKPKVLYVAADGPRINVKGEAQKCESVRKLVLDNIDWDCELKTLFRDNNLGCGSAVQGALDWFFEHEESGIILEDDILPDPSFFEFASRMLKEYHHDENIFSINGCNLGYKNQEQVYGLTRYFNMWGWATWRRSNKLVKKSWASVNLNMDFRSGSPLLKSLKLQTIWPLEEWYTLWRGHFKNTLNGKIDTWDYQWSYTCLKNELYAIRPNVNLVNNIGFNSAATHTKQMEGLDSDLLVASKINLDNIEEVKLEIDPQYEIKFTAEKWQHLNINYSLLLKKLRKEILALVKL